MPTRTPLENTPAAPLVYETPRVESIRLADGAVDGPTSNLITGS